jgi:hypothetical protein
MGLAGFIADVKISDSAYSMLNLLVETYGRFGLIRSRFVIQFAICGK